MSYRQDLREAELAVIRNAEAIVTDAENFVLEHGGFTTITNGMADLIRGVRALNVLRSQLDSAPAPYSEDDTSRTAADMIAPLAGSLRRSILVELYRRRKWPVPGATDDQLERALKRAHTSVSAARNFLVDTGWVIDSGHRVETCSGRPAKVWSLASGATDRLLNTIALEET